MRFLVTFFIAQLCHHFTKSSATKKIIEPTISSIHDYDLLLLENQQLSKTISSLIQTLLELKSTTGTTNAAPKILCEEFMHTSLSECRDSHVKCIERAYVTKQERKTARSIRRASLDPAELKDIKSQDEKNLQPQDMTPLQRKINFAKAFDVPLNPFSTLKLGAKIKVDDKKIKGEEIPNVEKNEKDEEKDEEKEKRGV